MAEPLAGILGRPFAEQVAALRARFADLRPTATWRDLWQAEHDRAFVVAGAMKAELLADLAQAVERAIAEGRGLDEFRRGFRSIVERHGWHGWTGEGTKAGEAWRTRVIYRTNAATSYAAGRWAQLRAGGFALLVYRHGGSREPRPQHLAWDGLVLPADHPFWATHAPPNGWGCSCYVLGARSAAGARRLGGAPDKRLPDGWNRPDPKTGAPPGIDRGWAYAPGASTVGTVTEIIASKVLKLPPLLGQELSKTAADIEEPDDPAATAALLRGLAGDAGPAAVREVEAFVQGRADDLPMSVSQAMALHAYTRTEWYRHLTAYQRARALGRVGPDPDLDEMARLIDQALRRLPAIEGTFARGVEDPPPRLAAFFAAAEPGDILSFEALSSFSARPIWDGPLQLVLRGFSGRSVKALSWKPDEDEVLFPAGLQFRILSITFRNGVRTVYLEELRPHRYRDLPEEARHAEGLG